MRLVANTLKAAGVFLAVAVIALWTYELIYMPLVAGEWLTVLLFVAACVFWIGLQEAARRKADSIDYSRR